ncbi:ABC transporter permease [Clostridium felsineum]|uniref:Dipeptide transport system permease protein DppB n=1 Tax=Clostridium felsineum TaxID=36839 RepID=A0A1S8L6R3_9CLOT|nr:ABC transporter permease [Clostridium felsineum]MCR3759649.1 ABC transporter permease [Clostridium felsineum]URZ02595.1 Dipeptide transport system permease protein DppB [Clostridium felsineum]URZ09722.1 Dipeptide transport system permease protein DppB [Clostridium felsineum]URZ18367.1 Dipeptide transport system permease protein DppB [Clostridium felsineum DSM 794]
MLRYIVKRLLQMIPILIGVSIVIFIIFSLAPGDIVDNMGVNSHMTTAKASQLRHLYHLDRSRPVQYLYWLKDMVTGNFGYSLEYRQPVSTVIKSYIWNSFILSFAAFIAAIVLAIPIGIISATKQYSAFDSTFTVIALIGISIPAFFMGLLLMKWFCIDIKIFPSSGMTQAGSNAVGIKKVGDILWHMFLPFVVLTFESVASLMRYMRTSMLEVIRQDYIRTARAKGLREKVVIYRHALKNSLIPVITVLGMWLPGLFCGAIITEQIFSWPGIGRVTLQAASHRDYPLLMGFNMLIAVLTLLGNLVADVAYGIVDPRIRLEK